MCTPAINGNCMHCAEKRITMPHELKSGAIIHVCSQCAKKITKAETQGGAA